MIKVILGVLGALGLLESLFFLMFEEKSKKVFLNLSKAKNLKNIARWELAIALILLILSVM